MMNHFSKMLFLRIFLFTLFCYLMVETKEIQLADENYYKKMLLNFCSDKPAKNFCSKTHIKINLDILRKKLDLQRVKQLDRRVELIKEALTQNSQMRFLKDFIVDRYF